MIESRNQRRTKEQKQIQRHAHTHVKPEHCVVIIMLDVLDIDECCIESTILQIARNERKDQQHAHNAIFSGR